MPNLGSQCVHGGYKPQNGDAQTLPIYQSTTFKFDSVEHLGNLFDLKAAGHFYTRLSNPTLEAVETKIATLEGGVGAMVTASGQSATLMAILNICSAGDNIVSSSTIYGGTYNLFAVTLAKMGIKTTFVDPECSEKELRAAIDENTKLVFGETISNPSINVLDIEKFAKIAHENGLPLFIDNTFPTPILCRPIEFGADIIIHSTSKYLDGHAVSLGGVIVDSGKFDWAKSGKFSAFTTPDDSYHGLVYSENFGNMAFIVKARVQLMRDLGAQMSPQNAFLLNLNMETLALRMKKHSENALLVAKFLESHPKVSWVSYPGLESSKFKARSDKYLKDGASGVLAFGVKGGREAAAQMMEKFKLVSLVIHVADVRTCALHPASTTHRQLSEEQLVGAGVSADLVRLSLGIEDVEDIIKDLENALA